MDGEKDILIPNYSRWIDSKRRLFIIIGKWYTGSGDSLQIVSVDMLEVEKEELHRKEYKEVRDYIQEGKIKRVLQ